MTGHKLIGRRSRPGLKGAGRFDQRAPPGALRQFDCICHIGMFSTDPLESAAEAGLRYVRSEGPAIRRIRSGRGFRYLGLDGRPLADAKHLERIPH